MIQRKQTIWLLLVALCAFATYWLPIYKGFLPNATTKMFLVPDDFLLFLLVFGIGVLAVVTIFLFKQRTLQFRLCIFGVLFSIVSIIFEYIRAEAFKVAGNFQSGSYQVGAFLPILMVILWILAARGIYKDEKLVKSLNRLR